MDGFNMDKFTVPHCRQNTSVNRASDKSHAYVDYDEPIGREKSMQKSLHYFYRAGEWDGPREIGVEVGVV